MKLVKYQIQDDVRNQIVLMSRILFVWSPSIYYYRDPVRDQIDDGIGLQIWRHLYEAG